MRYSEVYFECTGGTDWQKDLLIDELGRLGFDSFEERPQGFAGYIPTAAYDADSLELLLLRQADGFHVSYQYREIETQNWNALWESNFEPIAIDHRLYVRATFHVAPTGYPFEIVIDPKMAFGTGHHQTTSMMLRFMLDLDVRGKRVLDMGCGTGILAILAAKKEAASVLAIDNDEVCCASTAENTVLNRTPAIEIACGSEQLIAERKFDIILANINRNILLAHLPAYAQSLVKDGLLIMSGYFEEEDARILEEAANRLGFRLEAEKVDGKWSAGRFRRL